MLDPIQHHSLSKKVMLDRIQHHSLAKNVMLDPIQHHSLATNCSELHELLYNVILLHKV